MSFVRGERRKKSKLWFWPDAAAQPLLCLSLQSRPVHLHCRPWTLRARQWTSMEGSSATSVRCRSVPGVFQRQSRCFKEWAIHAGVDHHLVEKVMMEDSHSGHERGVDRGGEGPRRGGGGAGHWTAYHCPLERRYTSGRGRRGTTRR